MHGLSRFSKLKELHTDYDLLLGRNHSALSGRNEILATLPSSIKSLSPRCPRHKDMLRLEPLIQQMAALKEERFPKLCKLKLDTCIEQTESIEDLVIELECECEDVGIVLQVLCSVESFRSGR